MTEISMAPSPGTAPTFLNAGSTPAASTDYKLIIFNSLSSKGETGAHFCTLRPLTDFRSAGNLT
jgi:hypothetical protein